MGNANIRHLSRIICFLKDCGEPKTHTEIKEFTGITAHLKSCLQWLVSNKIVLIYDKIRDRKCYTINPEWEMLRNG